MKKREIQPMAVNRQISELRWQWRIYPHEFVQDGSASPSVVNCCDKCGIHIEKHSDSGEPFDFRSDWRDLLSDLVEASRGGSGVHIATDADLEMVTVTVGPVHVEGYKLGEAVCRAWLDWRTSPKKRKSKKET